VLIGSSTSLLKNQRKCQREVNLLLDHKFAIYAFIHCETFTKIQYISCKKINVACIYAHTKMKMLNLYLFQFFTIAHCMEI